MLPLDATDINQPDVDLVDEGRRLEDVVRSLARHVALCDAP